MNAKFRKNIFETSVITRYKKVHLGNEYLCKNLEHTMTGLLCDSHPYTIIMSNASRTF